MTRIERGRQDLAELSATEAFRNVEAGAGLAASLDIMAPEQLATIASATRRPPELQFFGTTDGQYAHLDAIIAREIDPVLNGSTLDVAYSVAELVVRREAEVAVSGDPNAQEGHAMLADLARMMEFLFISAPHSGAS